MEVSCRANKIAKPQEGAAGMPKVSRSSNHGVWEGARNEKKFMETLGKFMMECWSVVCQLRERVGLCPSYQMSSTEIAQRLDDLSRKLEDKYKEVEVLEAQKSVLLSKSPNATGGVSSSSYRSYFQPLASSTPAKKMGYSGNYTMSYSGTGSGGAWPSSMGASGGSSRQRSQFGGDSSGGGCPPACQEYSEMLSEGGSSGAYKAFGGPSYGF